jgi:hypothetical protein
MELEIRKRISTNKDCIKIGEFLYSAGEDSMFFSLDYPFPVQLKVTKLNKIEVTPGFLRLPTILRGGINIDILCRELDLIKFIQKGKLMLHASCVSDGEKGTLIVGFPQAGKTYNTYKSVSEGFELVSEEYTIIKNGVASAYKPLCRSCLSAKTIKDSRIILTKKEKLSLFLNTIRAKLMPFMFESVIWLDLPVSGRSAKVENIVYGSSTELIRDPKKLILLTENEFPFMGEYLLEAYAYITGFDLIKIQERQRELIKEFVNAVYNSTE